ncbi:MAG: 3-isopropylmalate dehydratase small subunit [Candidatus Omnitrophica bacterium]|nr:3-isopropylmalate dehydratase small subunit [Candidatus Omnitrophota bacterium]
MEPFTTLTSIAVPLDRSNVDTDAIIPKQFLRKIERTGFGKHLFHEWRYLDFEGTKENPEFILNKEPYRSKAKILLARDNFGCGSSREHAPWALADFGFRCIIAPSFADIFYSNCVKNGILLVRLKPEEVDEIFAVAAFGTTGLVAVDLDKQCVGAMGKKYTFEIDPFNKECLLKGMDQIGWTLQYAGLIDAFEQKNIVEKPWLN